MHLSRSMLLVAVLAAACVAGDREIVLADLARYPASEQWRYKYLTTTPVQGDAARETLELAASYVVPSLSRQLLLEHCSPTQVAETVYRIDLAGLLWTEADWFKFVADYPYNPTGSKYSTTVRLDWFLVNATDCTESDAYYRFVFGRVPATVEEAQAILGVDARNVVGVRSGLIEAKSGVSVSGKRNIENRPMTNGRLWITFDYLKLDGQRDPFEHPDRPGLNADGQELIFCIPKQKLGVRGHLQAYMLGNAAGKKVDKAPIDLVVDHSQVRGVYEIRNGVSCFSCHAGLNPFGENELAAELKGGAVEYLAKYDDQVAVESYHFGDLPKLLRRDNEDYAAIIHECNGATPEESTARFQLAVKRYDEPVDLERAAFELYIEPEELRLALQFQSSLGAKLGGRVSSLVDGGVMSRELFEENYLPLRLVADQWKDGHR